ncbi:MAG: DUF4390 domain-containing protein [Methylococcales bacterium]|nr:DUF4390 domain-containing protein [Methylococcales bacterium]
MLPFIFFRAFSVFRGQFFLIVFCLWANTVHATEVQQAEISIRGTQYVLSADIDYQLSDTAKEALQNGVPLFWTVRVKLLQQRDILWSKTLMDASIRYRLQYHALLNMYRVVIVQPDSKTIEQSGDSHNFSTLSAALDSMANLRNMPLLDVTEIQPEKQYFVHIKAQFERDALPLPLRPIAYTNRQWYLSSDWTVWSLLPVPNTQGNP